MNAIQESQRSMFLVVQEYIPSVDPVVLAKMPSFGPVYSAFENVIKDLNTASELQIYSRKGYSMDKEEQKDVMANASMNVLLCIKAYAVDQDNTVLYEEVNRPLSYIQKLSDTRARDYCSWVFLKGNELAADLLPFGLEAADLTALAESIDLYTLLIPKPRNQIVTRKQFTVEIKRLIALGLEQLFKMDAYVAALRYKEAAFYAAYFDNREIVDAGSRKLSLRGVITNTLGLPVEGVKVSIAALKLEKLSTAKGNYEMKHVPPGVYTATFEKEGMVTQQVPIAISANLRTDLDVVLANTETARIAS